MDDYDIQKGAKPEVVRAELRCWALFSVLMTGIFGLASALIEM